MIAGTRPGRAGPARPRLLPEGRRESPKLRAEVRRARRQMFELAGRHAASRGRRRTGASCESRRRSRRRALDRRQRRDPANVYHKMPLRELRGADARRSTGRVYFRERRSARRRRRQRRQPDFFKAVERRSSRRRRSTTGRPTCAGTCSHASAESCLPTRSSTRTSSSTARC